MWNLFLGFLMDVFIYMAGAVGSALGTTQVVTGKAEMPPLVVFLGCLCVAVVQAGRRWNSKLTPSPIKEEAVPVRTEAELMAQVKIREEAMTAVADAIKKAVEKPAVTPQRVDVPPAPEPVPTAPPPLPKQKDLKDSS